MVNVLPPLVRHFRQHKQTQGNFFASTFKQKFGSALHLPFTIHHLPFIIFFLVFLTFFAPPVAAQPADGAFYTTQLSDTLPHLAEKYLRSAEYAPSIAIATEKQLGQSIPDPLPPGFTLFIPNKPTAGHLPRWRAPCLPRLGRRYRTRLVGGTAERRTVLADWRLSGRLFSGLVSRWLAAGFCLAARK